LTPGTEAYIEAGRLNRAHVVPAGLAFARSIEARPDMNLHVADKRHPSPAGTYLTACTVLASIYGVSPVGNAYTAGLDPAVARHLQQTAWVTVQAYRLDAEPGAPVAGVSTWGGGARRPGAILRRLGLPSDGLLARFPKW
jgi:hypothetical protein